MKIEFHGAAQTVTGSQHLLTVNGKKILLDCGIYQGKREDSYRRNKDFGFNPAEVDVLVLSHAHIDHSGNIPNLVKRGFKGDIVCTYATRDLCAIMLRDSGKIQEQDVRYVNKKRKREGLPAREPIYTIADALASLRYFIGIGYDRPYTLFPGVTLTLYDAGHILGSAMVVLDIEDQESKKSQRVVFSGDIGRHDRPILNDPTYLDGADVLIMESTYGNREHASLGVDNTVLRDVVNRTINRRGNVIVPAFAVGRTQEIVYRLYQLMDDGEIPPVPVYVDSPLAINATSVYHLHPEAYDEELAGYLLEGEDPFHARKMHYTRSVDQSKQLNHLTEPAVIISASGMAEAGRIVHHLRNNIEDERNTVLIVGWQAPHTLGRRLVEKRPEVRIFGQPHQLRAEVAVMNGFSGHAGQSELLKWTGHMKQIPAKTFLVHGELDAASQLAADLRDKQGFPQVEIPATGDLFHV